MEKFDLKFHSKLVKNLPFSYFSAPLYLDFRAYIFKRNNEDLIVFQDPLYLHDFPSVFLPRKKVNWLKSTIAYATEQDILKIKKEKIEISIQIPIDSEYFYKTKSFLEPKQRIGKEIRRFERMYQYKILGIYPKNKIKTFYKKWKKQRHRVQPAFADLEGDQLFDFCLGHLKKYGMHQLYVEINKKLAGLIWAYRHPNGGWVSVQLKTDYKYKGLANFLRHQMSKEFSNISLFTTGTGCGDEGIRGYKNRLKPAIVTNYSYLFLGDKR